MNRSVRVGIVQEGPVYLDRAGSLQKAVCLAHQACEQGCEVIVFGETWFTGYPAWLDHCASAAIWDHKPTKQIFSRMHEHSIRVPGEETAALGALARKHGTVIVFGANEAVDEGPGGGTIYNSLITIDDRGAVANHHRKLMPTYTERLVYGLGDSHGLHAVDTKIGRVGSLICWEHWMPLARQVMHNSNEHIHVAVWPSVHEVHQLASRHYAFEGRCYVIAVGQILRAREIPAGLELPDRLKACPDAFLLNGGSCIIGPDSKYVLEPQFGREGLIICDIPDLGQTIEERLTLDTSGHYSRPDVFKLEISPCSRLNRTQ